MTANINTFEGYVRSITLYDFFQAEELLTRLGLSFDDKQHFINSIVNPIDEIFVSLGYEDKKPISLLGGISLLLTLLLVK